MVYDRGGQITAPGKFPCFFREACEFFKVPHAELVKLEACQLFKVPHVELVKIERLGQRLNVPTQGRRVAQKGTKPFSLTMPGSDPYPGIERYKCTK